MSFAPLQRHGHAVYTMRLYQTCIRGARCAFAYKGSFQILKLHLGKGGLWPPVASPLLVSPPNLKAGACL